MTFYTHPPWRMVRKLFLLIPVALLILSCGGPGKQTKTTGIYYQVKPGDTLTQISRIYRVSVRTLAEVNKITQPDQLTEGSVLFIPGSDDYFEKEPSPAVKPAGKEEAKGKTPVKPKASSETKGRETESVKKSQEIGPATDVSLPSPKHAEKSTPEIPPPTVRKTPISQPLWQSSTAQPDGGGSSAEKKHAGDLPPAGKETNKPVVKPDEDLQKSEKGRFLWPVKGKVTSRFGPQPNGMYFNHIRITTRENAPVITAAPGTVIFSAPLKEFGETIIIKHDQRFATVYTHLSTRLAKTDQQVKKGEQIGSSGKSEIKNEGYIHFEIREHNKSRNPLLFLP